MPKLSKEERLTYEEIERLYNEVQKGCDKPDGIYTPQGYLTSKGLYPYKEGEISPPCSD